MRPRSIVAAVGVALLGLVLVAPSASAGESITGGRWDGSHLNPQPGTNTSGQVYVTGEFRHSWLGASISLRFTVVPSDGGCPVAPPPDAAEVRSPRPVSLSFGVGCNGRYTVRVDAKSSYGDTAYLDQIVTVRMPAPTVTGVTTTPTDDGRSIDVTWDDMRPAAPDLSGYIVERKVGDDFEELASLAPEEHAYSDRELPESGGEATYRVFATRAAPGGSVTSQSSSEAATPFVAAPTDDSDASGSSSGDATGVGAGGGTTTGAGDNAGGSASSDSSQPSRTGVTRVAPRSPRFSVSLPSALLRPGPRAAAGSTTPTTVDGGFDESLPYATAEGAEPGDEDPVLPDDEMASIFTESQPGRGMAIPVAVALVLAVWALHLRMLAAASRPHG